MPARRTADTGHFGPKIGRAGRAIFGLDVLTASRVRLGVLLLPGHAPEQHYGGVQGRDLMQQCVEIHDDAHRFALRPGFSAGHRGRAIAAASTSRSLIAVRQVLTLMVPVIGLALLSRAASPTQARPGPEVEPKQD